MIIYKITNDINGRVYIGQTTTTLKERIRNYKNEYKFDRRHRPILDAMKKYGFEKFHFEVLCECKTREELDFKEREYIKIFNSLCSQNGYNIELGGNGRGKHSKATKEKMSKAQLGPKNHMYGNTGNMNAASKEIVELTTGLTFESANLAAQYFGLGFSHVCSVARGERGSTGGYVFRYIENNNIVQPAEIAKIKNLSLREKILPQYKKYV